MARYCSAFGMNVIVCDPYKNVFNFDQVSLEEVMKRSDLVSLHVHVKEDTFEMINRETLSLCKNSPYIINTSRGEIVNESDILAALREQKISGYGADVIVDEFSNTSDSDIISAINNENLNLIVTPHIGGMSIEGQNRAYLHAIGKFRNEQY